MKAVQRVQQLTQQLQELGRAAESIGDRYAAHMALHRAAMRDGDKEQCMEHRQALHVLLDRLLDNEKQISDATNEMTTVIRQAGG